MVVRAILAATAAAAAMALVPAPSRAQDPLEIQQLADSWTRAYNEADTTGLGALYADTAELYVNNGGRYVGREAITQYWADAMRDGAPITVLTVTDWVEDPEMRLVHGNYLVVDRVTGVPLGSGRFAQIWVLDDLEWELDRDVWVDRQNAPE